MNGNFIAILSGVLLFSTASIGADKDQELQKLEAAVADVDVREDATPNEYRDAYYALADHLLARGQIPRGRRALERALSMDGDNHPRQLQLVRRLLPDRPGETISRLERIRDTAGNRDTSRQAEVLLGQIRSLSGPPSGSPKPRFHESLHVLGFAGLDPITLRGISDGVSRLLKVKTIIVPETLTEELFNHSSERERQFRDIARGAQKQLGEEAYRLAIKKLGLTKKEVALPKGREVFVRWFLESRPDGAQRLAGVSQDDVERYDASVLIYQLVKSQRAWIEAPESIGVMGITDKDIYSGKKPFVFCAIYPRISVVSTAQLTRPADPRHIIIDRTLAQLEMVAENLLPEETSMAKLVEGDEGP